MSASSPLSRRHVLLGGALAGAASAIRPGAAQASADGLAPEPEDHRRVVLKDTPHTRAYYALARDS